MLVRLLYASRASDEIDDSLLHSILERSRASNLEHGITGIWLMYEPSIRLPLVIYDPRLPKSRRECLLNQVCL